MLFWTGPWLLKEDGRGGRYPAKSRLASRLFGMPTTKAEIVIVHTSYRCEHKGLATRRWNCRRWNWQLLTGLDLR